MVVSLTAWLNRGRVAKLAPRAILRPAHRPAQARRDQRPIHSATEVTAGQRSPDAGPQTAQQTGPSRSVTMSPFAFPLLCTEAGSAPLYPLGEPIGEVAGHPESALLIIEPPRGPAAPDHRRHCRASSRLAAADPRGASPSALPAQAAFRRLRSRLESAGWWRRR